MAEDINKVMLVGRLPRDAELSYTNSGIALCKFSLAVNRRKKQGDQWIDEGNFFELNLWGRRGENLNSYLTKGVQVAIEGQLRQERWEQDGRNRSKVSIEVVNIQLLGGRRDDNRQGPSPGNSNRSSGGNRQGSGNRKQQGGRNSYESYTPPSQPRQDNYEDDIPF
ncbi:MAG: single-stranded DNA-binding protein [Spirochaetales bacterium]|nr:single-stranded DNA-binding protein [Spirochaetales bacterium]